MSARMYLIALSVLVSAAAARRRPPPHLPPPDQWNMLIQKHAPFSPTCVRDLGSVYSRRTCILSYDGRAHVRQTCVGPTASFIAVAPPAPRLLLHGRV